MIHLTRWRRARKAAARSGTRSRWLRASAVPLRDGGSLDEVCRAALGEVPQRVQAVGRGRNGSASFRLQMSSGYVKCYETASPARAQMVRRATAALQAQGIAIPEIRATAGAVVFAPWVDGMPAEVEAEAMWPTIAEYQSRIHHAAVENIQPRERDFVHGRFLVDWLLAEVRGHGALSVPESLDERIASLAPPGLRVSVTIPDYIPSNLVVRRDGTVTLVDSELLAVSTGFEFDLLNTIRVALRNDPESVSAYLDAYRRDGGIGTLRSHAPYWEMVYTIKIAAKRLSQGRIEEGARALADLKRRLAAYARHAGA